MNLFKIFFIIFLLILPSVSFAGKGYDLGPENIAWNVSSGNKLCPNGKVLLDKDDNKSQPRNGTVTCFRKDNTAPTITITWLQGKDNEWVNNNVSINVKVSDSQSGLGAIFYYVNGIKYNTDSNFNINLSEEGLYSIQIYAYDLATIDGNTGGGTTANLASKNITVKIDKSEPSIIVDAISDWINTKPKVKYKVIDYYKGQDIRIKTFHCTGKPTNNSTYLPPVVNGDITGSCNAGVLDCSNDSNYESNISNCNRECDSGYTKSLDGKSCMANTISLSCNTSTTVSLPTFVYYYSKNNSLESEGNSVGKVHWSSPTGVSFEGNFLSNYDVNTGNYLPSVNSCNYSCNDGYHVETNNGGKCVNNTSVICCSKPPLGYIADTGFTDCSLAINQNTPKCAYNNLCGGYIKDVLGQWDNNSMKWNYTDQSLTNFANVSNACGYSNLPNSDGFVCNKRYYLIGSEANSTLKCEVVPIGEWSNDGVDGNKKFSCTNKPNNAVYTTNGDNNNCSWTCNNGYEKNGNNCKSFDWNTSGWSNCSASCGGGTKTRSVYCTNSKGQIVNDNNCLGNKPSETSSCNTQACPIDGNCSFLPGICTSGNVFGDNGVSCGTRTWSCLGQFGGNDDSCSKNLGNCDFGSGGTN